MKLKRYLKKMCIEYDKANDLGLSEAKISNAAKLCLVRSNISQDTEIDDLSPALRVALMQVVKSTMEIVRASTSMGSK